MKKRKIKKKIKLYFIFLFVFLLIIVILLLLNNNKEIKIAKSTTSISTTTTQKKENIKLTIVGDLLFESPYYKSIEKGDSKDIYLSLLKDTFKNDDLTIGNMEVVIGNENLNVSGDGYNFCAPSWVGDLVKDNNFDVLTTANNHSYDRGIEGVNSTIDYFKKTNILTVGTYKNKEERDKLHIKEINGTKIAFLAYTLGTNIKVPTEYKNNISFYRDTTTKSLTEEYKEILKEEINYAKTNSDFLIVLVHWGTEFTYTPTNEQKELANFLSNLGVNIIIGSHSHSIQPIEKINDTLVFYSMGNFISADDDISRTGEEFDNAYQFGLLAQIEINDNKKIEKIKTNIIVNYYDKDMRNFILVPLNKYDQYEKSHYRYKMGLTKDFITNTYNKVIDSKYH